MNTIAARQRILSKIVDWGATRGDVRAIAVVGSGARSDHPADAWSDLDIIVVARRPRRYLGDPRWLAAIERPWLVLRDRTPIGDQEIFHATFEGGATLDLVVVPSTAFSLAARSLQTLRRYPLAAALLPRIARDQLDVLSDLVSHGIRFELDKDRIADRLTRVGLPTPSPRSPSEQEFLDLVSRFLNEQVSVALKMGRGELFVAKTSGESRLMALLLQMIEWHTQATSDRWSPVFERGRFLEEWAPPIVIERLQGTFPTYDPAGVWRARLEALDLFRLLAEETGAQLGFSYPRQLEETVMSWVRSQEPGGRESAAACDSTQDGPLAPHPKATLQQRT